MADDLARRFATELSAVDGTPHPSADARTVALELVGREPTLVAVEDDPTVEPVAATLADAGHEVLRPPDVGFRDRLPDAALGVTACTAAIADTGTLLLAADRAHPRGTSLLPRRPVRAAPRARARARGRRGSRSARCRPSGSGR